ncbi:hypothetical protein F4824DRAFT_481570 [Ustulina deusta]|nr:hypothetical protein F4823DRAFT_577529 [Ustulina deusta]KAI3329639.1 hypothetical protein F4824DRAFT_481570 [Ustulina deusta]
MKLFLVVGAAALVHAQADSGGYFPGEPPCALPCLASAITAAGCELSDIACQCGPTQSVIADKVGGCILSSCTNPTDLGAAISAGQAVCSSFLAGELTTPPGPPPTSTPVTASSSKSDTPHTSAILTSPSTPTPTTWSNETSIGTGSGSVSTTLKGTHTDTLLGSSTAVLTGSHTTLPTSAPPTAAAATSTWLGAGVLAGIMGVVALL